MATNDDILNKIDSLHKETMTEVKEIQEQLNKLEDAYNIHVAVGKALDKQKKITNKQKVAISIGIVPIILGIYAVFH
jgi:uncharacterized protein YxjI